METKICKLCKIDKPLVDYYSNGYHKSGRKYKPECISCSKRIRFEDFFRKLNTVVTEWKCESCGYDEHREGLEFHHVDPTTKLFNISSYKTSSIERLKREIEKCKLLCSRCHSEIHAGVRKLGD